MAKHFYISIGINKANGNSLMNSCNHLSHIDGTKKSGSVVQLVPKFPHPLISFQLKFIYERRKSNSAHCNDDDDDVWKLRYQRLRRWTHELRTKLKPGNLCNFSCLDCFRCLRCRRAVCLVFMPAISPHTAHNHSHIICKDFCIYCQRFQGFPSPNRDPNPTPTAIPIRIRIWLQ